MKKVAFDLGNVIVKVDWSMFIEEWRKHKLGDARAFMRDIQHQQDLGLLTIDRALASKYSMHYSANLILISAWESAISLDNDMLSLLNKYKQTHDVAILSNIGPEHARVMRSSYPSVFEGAKLHLSYEVGARKPTKLYFQSFLMENPDFVGATFVDDLEENLVMAERFGFKGYQFNLANHNKLNDEQKHLEILQLRKAIG